MLGQFLATKHCKNNLSALGVARFFDRIPIVGYSKGLEIRRLIGSAVAGFNHARTITKASAKGLDTRQDDYNKGICFPESLVNNPVR